MVIELYKEALQTITSGNELSSDFAFEELKTIECATTKAKIENKPVEALNELRDDLRIFGRLCEN
jgi:hypothetical protein